MDYEYGLQTLEKHLVNSPDALSELHVLAARLRESLRDEKLFGLTEFGRLERARIVYRLNELAVRTIQRSFNGLCAEVMPGDSTGRSDEDAVALQRALASAAYEQGRLFVQQGRWADGLRLLEESLAIRRQGDDLDALADVIYQIAFTRHLMGDAEQARIRYRDALRLYERTGNQRGVAACKTGLGRLAVQIGMLDDAKRELKQAKTLYAELGDTQRLREAEEVLRVAGAEAFAQHCPASGVKLNTSDETRHIR